VGLRSGVFVAMGNRRTIDMATITWIHHASVLIEGEKRIYIDPWKLAGLGTPRTADLVLVTHDHFDHLSPPDLELIVTDATEILAPKSALAQLGGSAGRVRPVAVGDVLQAAGLRVEVVAAYNVGKKFHPKAAGNVGYVVTVDGERIYHAGDTDRIPEMMGLAPDVALLPIGGTYTMTSAEAAEAVRDLGAKRAIPIHFGDIVGSRQDALDFQQRCSVPVEILEPAA
jgi:L-ascorbate metabolism protein UlaG (beta-lactamase superfamily)